MHFTLRRTLNWLLGLILIVGPTLLVLWQYQNIVNWVKLRNYHAPSDIASLASQDTMTSYARKMFYINHPQIVSDVASFRKDCAENEQTIVLGCYHSNESGIYVFNPQDSRLNGIEQVTAAHETLHAIYEQLSSKDRSYVNGLLNDYYQNGLTSRRIIDEIKLYQKTEPNSVADEMHSVFGSEAANLPAPLEQYYAKYFSNRSSVVAYGQKYQAEFDSRQAAVAADDARLATMRTQITAEEQSLQLQLDKVNRDRNQLDQDRANNNTTAYNAGVDNYNNEVASYNSGVSKLKSDISAYNQLVAQRNAVAKSLASLDKAIDTRLSTQPSQ